MTTSTGGPTLLHPEDMRRRSQSTAPRSMGLPTDLVERATGRLQVLALLYAGVFFMAGFFSQLIDPHDRAMLLSSPFNWLPGTLSIAVALVVALTIRSPRLSPELATLVAFVFEVASSYGIAAAEFLNPVNL